MCRSGASRAAEASVPASSVGVVTLYLHRAERTDLLADELAGLLRTPLEDPFAEEVVVVPARGVERWLTQRLSHRLGTGERGGDGVCAGVRLISPHSLVAMLLGKERDDIWDPDRMVWPLLETIDASLGEPWCRTLSDHLGHGRDDDLGLLRQERRYSVARRLAGLFASYAVQRPALIAAWREGRDEDGVGGPLEPDLRWQAELWRRLVERVDQPPPDVRHTETLRRLETGADGLELPPRLSLFGHTRLPVTEVQLLQALGRLRDVHLWLPQASPHLWDALAPAVQDGPVPRRLDRSAEAVGHPLLASLGRDSRELQRTLAVADEAVDTGCAEAEDGPATLLNWLQHDLRHNAEPDAATREARRVDLLDDSVQVHACHGPSRQVDVLREVLVGLLEDDPTLEPRDILVMCPDIETYAPLIQAGFGLADVADEEAGEDQGHPAHRLRVRLADRALTSTNPLLAVARQLVLLAGGRVTATEVLDLASTGPVRYRFGFDDDDLQQVGSWVDQAGIRWGLHSEHRSAYGLGNLGQNTWRFGLDRVLAGVAMAEDEHRWIGSALPVDDVASGDIDLAGRLAELLDRLELTLRQLHQARSVRDWTTALSEGVSRLADVPDTDAWQVAQFDRELARIADAATEAGPGSTLRLSDVRHLLEHRLAGRPTRANFRTGTLTVCTMVPMRSVPHRVVCLVGLDDGEFPRSLTVDGDDVLARDPVTGERDVRSEDRQLLLDAIMAAQEKLVITYTGANEHTGAERPPAVPLGEILDAVHRTATFPPDRDSVVIRHPLQPFDVRNLRPGALLPVERPFSFDRAALSGAEAATGPRQRPGALVPEPLPPRTDSDITLADLQAFFAHPARHFLRRRLDVASPEEAEERRDSMPITLDGLETWSVGDRLLRDILDGMDPEASCTAEQLRGLLPPQQLGVKVLHEVVLVVQELIRASAPLRREPARTLDIAIDLGDGRRLVGSVPEVHGDAVVSVTYSSLRAKQRLASWINLLALTVGHPGTPWRSAAVGRGTGYGRQRSTAHVAEAGPLDHSARTYLLDLVDLYDRGLREPVPLPLRTAYAYAEAWRRFRATGETDPRDAAANEWFTQRSQPNRPPGEQDDPAHVKVLGAEAPVEVLLGPPRPDERWNDATTRLGQYALRVWEPVLDHERVRRL